MNNKRLFGTIELCFDAVYLLTAAGIGLFLLLRNKYPTDLTAGWMALVLSGGDAFHLIPRMLSILDERRQLLTALGRGKQITSITMTIFYLLLWQIAGMRLVIPQKTGLTALVWALALLRMALCLAPQNGWVHPRPPLRWALVRNLPFFLLGGVIATVFARCAGSATPLSQMWIAIVISFCCYAPVVALSNTHPKVGMLMLPKTCAYLWMLLMVLFP